MMQTVINTMLAENARQNDSISRREVIAFIQSHICEIITESGTDKNEHTNKILRAIIDGIKEMPSKKASTVNIVNNGTANIEM